MGGTTKKGGHIKKSFSGALRRNLCPPLLKCFRRHCGQVADPLIAKASQDELSLTRPSLSKNPCTSGVATVDKPCAGRTTQHELRLQRQNQRLGLRQQM